MKIVRWKGFLPFVLITVGVYVFATYYLDHFLKNSLVKQGTKLNGALVDVDSVTLSFLSSKLEIQDLRVTDPEDLMKNRFEVNELVADLQFLPLLKKKVVIDDVKIERIQWATQRKKPGKVPEAWKKEWAKQEASAGPSLWSQTLDELKAKFKTKFPELDLAQLGDRFNPKKFVKLEDIQAYQRAKNIPSETKKLVRNWKKESQTFVSKQKQELSKIRNKAKTLDPRKIKTVPQVVSAIQTLESFKGDLKEQESKVVHLTKKAKSELENQVGQIARLKSDMKEDIERLKSKIGLGDWKLDRLSEGVFGLTVVEKYRKFLEYYLTAKQYAERYKGTSKKPKKERMKGRMVYFPITDHTPKFLLSHALVSSDTRENEAVPESYRGLYVLEGKDFTSHPKLWKRPMVASLTADMVAGHFKNAGVSFRYQADEQEDQTAFEAHVKGIRLDDIELGKGAVFSLPLKRGQADWKSNLLFHHDQVEASMVGSFSALKYAFQNDAHTHPVLKILREVMSEIKTFSVKIGLSGELKKPKISISSTFDNALKNGLERTLMKKVRKAQKKLEAYLRKEIGSRISEAEKEIAKQKKNILNELAVQKKRVTQLKTELEKKVAAFKDKQKKLLREKTEKAKKKASKKVKDVGKDMKKSLGF